MATNEATNTQQTLGERIATLRKSHNFTQEEFSQLLGVSAQAVSKWENGVSCPDIMLLPQISEILGVSIDELMGMKPKVSTSEETQLNAQPLNLSKLKFRIHIIDAKNKPVNITLPMAFVMKAANIGVKISGVLGNNVITDAQLNEILELVKNGVTGEVLNLSEENGTSVSIEIS